MSHRGQRTLDGYHLNHLEKTFFYPKVTKFHKYYKKCCKKSINKKTGKLEQCQNDVVNKPNRFYCAEHYRQLQKEVKPFSEPLLLNLLLDIEEK